MRSKWLSHNVLVHLALIPALLALAACQYFEQQVAEEAEALATKQSASTTGVQESPDEDLVEGEVSDTSSEIPMTGVTEMEEIVSATEFFTVKIPAGWSRQEVVPGADFVLGNSEAALERYNTRGDIESGDYVLNVGFLPLALLQERDLSHLGFQFDASPEVFLQSLLPLFRSGDLPAGDNAGEAVLVSLSDEREAGMLTLSDEGREGLILVFTAGDGVLAFVSAVGYPGETGSLQEIAYAVAAEVVFSGTQDALYGALYGG
jgi:hypothetical protein